MTSENTTYAQDLEAANARNWATIEALKNLDYSKFSIKLGPYSATYANKKANEWVDRQMAHTIRVRVEGSGKQTYLVVSSHSEAFLSDFVSKSKKA